MDTAFYSLGYQKNQRILYVIFQNVHFGLYILNFINKHSRETQLRILLHFTVWETLGSTIWFHSGTYWFHPGTTWFQARTPWFQAGTPWW